MSFRVTVAGRSAFLLVAAALALVMSGCALQRAADNGAVTPATPAATTSVDASAVATSSAEDGVPLAVRSLGAGDPERESILDALRVSVDRELGQPTKFEVRFVNVLSGFAAVDAKPVQTDGRPIDYLRLPKYAPAVRAGAFDDGVLALLQFSGGRWRVLEFGIGSTDFPGEYWGQQHHVPGGLAIWQSQ